MISFFDENYDFLVTYGPTVTITGLFIFYTMFLVVLYKSKEGSKFNRYAFSVLAIALLPNFFAHLSLAVVHGAWMPFVAEIVNLTPVLIFLALNEFYLIKGVD